MKTKGKATRAAKAKTDAPSEGELSFEPIAEKFLTQRGVTEAKMFGSRVLKVNGKVFAMVVRGDLVIKLAAERVNERVNARRGSYFDPGHGKVAKEWVTVPVAHKSDWITLVEQAKEFVSGLK